MIQNIKKQDKFTIDKAEWELTFEDNFEFLDRTKWAVDKTLRRVCYNVDDDDILFTKDGKLYIRTKWKNGAFGEGWYSAMLGTCTKPHKLTDTFTFSEDFKGFSQTYGYFEARCKVPKVIGIWSAFWLMPDNDIAFTEDDVQDTAEDGLEIDVMESPHSYRFTKRAQNENIHVLHADGYDSRLKSLRSPAFHVENMYDDFHTYGLLWEKDKYTFYIDGYKTWETTHVYEGHPMGICKVPEYLLLSTEVGGIVENGKLLIGKEKDAKGKLKTFWAGDANRNDKSKSYDFIVDYVRVWQKKED